MNPEQVRRASAQALFALRESEFAPALPVEGFAVSPSRMTSSPLSSLPGQQAFVRERTARFSGPIRDYLLSEHAGKLGQRTPESTSPWYAANNWLTREVNTLKAHTVHKAFDEQDLRESAEHYASLCRRIAPRKFSSNPADDELALFRCLAKRIDFAHTAGIDIEKRAGMTYHGLYARLEESLWWRHQLRRIWTRAAENSLRRMGLVRRGKSAYVSEDAYRAKQGQYRLMRQFIEHHELVNEAGETVLLEEIVKRSLANPALRRGELMARLRGLEEAMGLWRWADFYTLTVPSAFHPQLQAGGANPRYAGFSVQDAQAWLTDRWARVRSWLKREKIPVYGIRVCEPHHDGTPHWHMVVFGKDEELKALSERVHKVWLAEYADEPGAAEHRVQVKRIDHGQGSAVGYVAKYISKNIDAAGEIGDAISDETGVSSADSVKRVQVWASVHGLRQFSVFGAPPVGPYRELRRLRDPLPDPDLERARAAADRGAVCHYFYAQGGVMVGRYGNVRIEKAETGELNRYGEVRAARIVGLTCASTFVETRPHRWRMQKCGGSYSVTSPAPARSSSPVVSAPAFAPGASERYAAWRQRIEKRTLEKYSSRMCINWEKSEPSPSMRVTKTTTTDQSWYAKNSQKLYAESAAGTTRHSESWGTRDNRTILTTTQRRLKDSIVPLPDYGKWNTQETLNELRRENRRLN